MADQNIPAEHSDKAMQQPTRDVVVVLGMHRSGTSLCMQVLDELGVRVDDDLLGADVNNPRGYFESGEFVELNDYILGCLGLTWRTLFSVALDQDWLNKPVLAEPRSRLTALVRRKAAGGPGIWAFKDPRLCVLLPLYEKVFADCGVEPLYVVSVRDPRSVALSLFRRDRFPEAFSELLWIENTIRAIQAGGERIRAVVHYENWFRDGRAQLDSLIEGLRLGQHSDDELAQVLANTVARSLNHADQENAPFAFPCAESIYRLLQSGDYAGAVRQFGELQGLLKWMTFPGKNTCRLCWRREGEDFVRTRSSVLLTDIDSTRQRIRVWVAPGIRGLAGLRLDPASQAGIARLFAIRLLSNDGRVLWEWDGSAEALQACQSHGITFRSRGSGPGVIAHFHDGNASLVLPVSERLHEIEDGGIVECESEWVVTSGLSGLEFAEGLADESKDWRAEAAALQEELAARSAKIEALREELRTVRAEKDWCVGELQRAADWRQSVLGSWSWRLTAPLRSLGSLFLR